MNVEVDDPGVYHQDFTSASSWEEFTDRVEKIIIDWKLNQPRNRQPIKRGDLDGEWEKKTEEIHFEDERLHLSWWTLKDGSVIVNEETENTPSTVPQSFVDMMSIGGDFVSVSSCPKLAQLYGIRDFLLLNCDRKSTMSSETKAKILLSSLTMAISATGCEIPAFIQLLESWQQFYLGSCTGRDLSADYEMVHLERTPQHCKYLTGLLDLFKSKISRGVQLPSVNMAVQLTYTLRILEQWENLRKKSGFNENSSSLMTLPFGLASDPISKLHLLATWPQLTDQMVVDSQSYSDLEPMQAHVWALRIELAENLKCPQLSLSLASLCNMASEPLAPLLNRSDNSFEKSLGAITQIKRPTIFKVFDALDNALDSLDSNRRKNFWEGSIPTPKLLEYLAFLDPLDEADAEFKDDSLDVSTSSQPKETNAKFAVLEGVKSTAPESLVWRIALLIPLVYREGGISAVALIWFWINRHLAIYWEGSRLMSRVQAGYTDHKTCILNQKMQMMNVCIERKMARASPSHQSTGHKGTLDSDGEDEDQFFDCDVSSPASAADVDMEDAAEETKEDPVKHSLWDQPEGRKSKHATLKLLETGEPLYVPVTQVLVPKTEDQLDAANDWATAAAALGSSHHSQAHLYSCTVTLSDMESFKAANPGCVLGDFVRWYSPRDWVEDADGELDAWGQRKGELSARMQLQDNTWLDLWAVAQPVSAVRQRHLFDETRNAEGVMSWMQNLSAHGLALAVLPVLAHACALRLLAEASRDALVRRVPGLQAAVERIAEQVKSATREPQQSVKTYQRLVVDMEAVERRICTARSLSAALCTDIADLDSDDAPPSATEMMDFLVALLDEKDVPVPGGPRGSIGINIRRMFSQAQMMAQMLPQSTAGGPGGRGGPGGPEGPRREGGEASFPAADVKEVVMRVVTPRPGPASKHCPQRMYATLLKDEFRLSGCFSRDVAFS